MRRVLSTTPMELPALLPATGSLKSGRRMGERQNLGLNNLSRQDLFKLSIPAHKERLQGGSINDFASAYVLLSDI